MKDSAPIARLTHYNRPQLLRSYSVEKPETHDDLRLSVLSERSSEIKQLLKARGIESFQSENNLLISGGIDGAREAAAVLDSALPPEYSFSIREVISNYLNYGKIRLNAGSRSLRADAISIMGILNVTPDSFSDGGLYFSLPKALQHAEDMIRDGADIIDVGGESTRPGSSAVDAEEELKRVLPVVAEIKKAHPETLVSVDTNKASVAESSILAGADIINDISSLEFDPGMLHLIKKHRVPVVIMHMRGVPKTMQDSPSYWDAPTEVYDFLYRKVKELRRQGIEDVIIDPGIGFGKRPVDNYEIINRLDELKGIGKLILMALSRKTFLGKAFESEDKMCPAPDRRDNATLAAETCSLIRGASMIRTHNLKNANEARTIINFIMNPELIQDV